MGGYQACQRSEVAVAVAGVAFELWDSYKQYEKEQEFQKAKNTMKENFEGQRKEILGLINSESFIETFFPQYLELKDIYVRTNDEMVAIKSK
ncbi:LeoA/HP0731 family dynamin-like GTPase [Helicobacter mesocricetorum]|uniref:LeoA/HP0731 family dynamin-like GTPase n=1 Tax=Helicobacter mesocricetorum TaxID=87012 RepID=UPI0013152884|nr:LeoA/HP0731 family dynamin-like GTPase [Helicobacter mesocricetorum]